MSTRYFKVGDFVRLRVGQSVFWVDEELEAEGEDARVRVRLPSGATGTVIKVRSHPTPLPYVVNFNDKEIGVREDDLERAQR